MSLDPYIADGQDAGETLGAIRVALVGLNPAEPVIFAPADSEFESEWESWISGKFLPVIAPHLIEVRNICGSVAPREVAHLDSKFATLLDPAESARSIRAAIALRDSLAGARHRPELDKLLALFDSKPSGHQNGQFPTVFAARCASHHVSLSSTLAAYLYFEITSAIATLGEKRSGFTSASVLPLIVPAVRLALDSCPPGSYRVA